MSDNGSSDGSADDQMVETTFQFFVFDHPPQVASAQRSGATSSSSAPDQPTNATTGQPSTTGPDGGGTGVGRFHFVLPSTSIFNSADGTATIRFEFDASFGGDDDDGPEPATSSSSTPATNNSNNNNNAGNNAASTGGINGSSSRPANSSDPPGRGVTNLPPFASIGGNHRQQGGATAGGGAIPPFPVFRFFPNDQRSQNPRSGPYNLRARPATSAGGAQEPNQRMASTLLRHLLAVPSGQPDRNRGGEDPPRLTDTFTNLIMEVLLLAGAIGTAPHLQGQPPASNNAKNELIILPSLPSDLRQQSPNCVICQEEFAQEPAVDDPEQCIRQMPCKHIFHQACLFRWLEQSNQCPTCRYEIMTDNEEYNTAMRTRMATRDAEIEQEEKRLRELQEQSLSKERPSIASHSQSKERIIQPQSTETATSRPHTSRKRRRQDTDKVDEVQPPLVVETESTSNRLRKRRRDDQSKSASASRSSISIPSTPNESSGSSRAVKRPRRGRGTPPPPADAPRYQLRDRRPHNMH